MTTSSRVRGWAAYVVVAVALKVVMRLRGLDGLS